MEGKRGNEGESRLRSLSLSVCLFLSIRQSVQSLAETKRKKRLRFKRRKKKKCCAKRETVMLKNGTGGISEGGGVSACGRDSGIPQILPLKMAAGEKYDSLGGVFF